MRIKKNNCIIATEISGITSYSHYKKLFPNCINNIILSN